ncbi:hypothetical protein EUTSA_v10000773mg [Eutrema salsugineum]|uniref:Uncharacterized protein n=2 Tax=Eutrema salsugineum TaxID=72664 RepID=V4KPP1_EUTSA|nr:hypothetical protein EUTSA_v10000773mg [Eutrema salsugineum]
MYNCKDNLVSLKEALGDLTAIRNEVENQVKAGELKGEKRVPTVARWLLQVETIETDINQLVHAASAQDASAQDASAQDASPQDASAGHQGLSTSGCCGWPSPFFLGEEVFKKLNEVEELCSKPKDFKDLTKQSLPPVVEIRGVEETFGLGATFEKTWESLKRKKILGIYGMGGVGKTTLLTVINNKFGEDNTVKGKFDVVIWVKVSEDADVGNIEDDKKKKIPIDIEKIQDTIGERLHLCDEKWSTYKKPKKKGEILRVLREERPRFVLLLDDLREEVSLSAIGIPLLGSEYKIVFTTRSEDVCGRMADEKIRVDLLGDDDARALFNLNAKFSRLTVQVDEIRDIANNIVAKCCGLPLALRVIGKTMASKATVDQWRRASEQLDSRPSELKGTDDLFKVLKLSYDDLKDEDAKCFQYCALFPKAHNIKQDELVEYWIGEGFINDNNGGYNIIDTLVEASLLLKDGKSQDSEQKVYMHDMIRGMVLWVRSKSNPENGEVFVVQAGAKLSHLPNDTDWTAVTKMSLMDNEINGIPNDEDLPNPDHLVTLFLQKNKLVEIAGTFFEVLSTLVVLDLSHNRSITDLPKEISKLVALRYLSLLGTMIKDLPEGFAKLTQLIHLDLESTSNLQSISLSLISTLLKLQVLRFYGSKASLDVSLLEHLKGLKRLHTLTITVRKVDVLEAFLRSEELAGKTQGLYLEGVTVSVASFAVTFGALGSLRNLKMMGCDIIESDTEWKRGDLASSSSNQTTPSNPLFNNLSAVELSSCLLLRDATWLIYAAKLESLSIALSPKMKQVISKEKVRDDKDEPFPLLQVLDFNYLDELESICWKPLSSKALQKVCVTNCPKLLFNEISASKIDVMITRLASKV